MVAGSQAAGSAAWTRSLNDCPTAIPQTSQRNIAKMITP